MTKLYINTAGLTLRADCGATVDLSIATTTKIKAKKPDGTEIEWEATVADTHYLEYTTTEDDIDVAGEWRIQSYAEIGDWKGPGETKLLKFYERFK